MNFKKTNLFIAALCLCSAAQAEQADSTLTYRIEASGNVSEGTYAPLWFTANRYGLSSQEPNSGFLRAGIAYNRQLPHHWRIQAGLDLAGTVNQTSNFVVQQAYGDISWRFLTLSIGSKERTGGPLEKNERLSSGMMVEGNNARPVPQVRGEIADYISIPGTKGWLALKGHIAYGMFTDNSWQENFAAAGQSYGRDILYHSKALMFRIGNREKLPLEFEFGLLDAAQFAGDQMKKNADGSSTLVHDMPDGLDSFIKAFLPVRSEDKMANVEGNHVGSWNFALNYYLHDWKFRVYLEHYFDDHSQMFWQYGRWKDGQLGIDITLPKNRFVSNVVWEMMSTKDQTGPILYDGFAGSFPEYQVSAGDNYYNNGGYQAWQHWGYGMGNPLLPGPIYNQDGKITFKSNRVRSHHVGIEGNPATEWNYRVLVSFARHWGTYFVPLDKQRKQFSSLYEVTYTPQWTKGWSVSAALGVDRGNYLGNSTGGMLTIRKTGGIL